MKLQPKKLILASKSPRRKMLLKKLGVKFIVLPSGVDESSRQRIPKKLVQELALRKASAVAQRLQRGLVIGADTLVFWRTQRFGQPKDIDEAYRMLYRLSGSRHRVYTGVAVVDAETGRSTQDYAMSEVAMKKLPLDEVLRLARKHMDKAGSYAIQERNDPIAKVVKGSYENVVGLPLDVVKRLLSRFGVKTTSK